MFGGYAHVISPFSHMTIADLTNCATPMLYKNFGNIDSYSHNHNFDDIM